MKSTTVARGDRAPGFNLPGVDGLRRDLDAYVGRKILLVFYRGHW